MDKTNLILPKELALRHQAAPRLILATGVIRVRSVCPLSASALAEIQLWAGHYLENASLSIDEFTKELTEIYPDGKDLGLPPAKFTILAREGAASSVARDADGKPVVKIVNDCISRGIELGASDIHLEPREKSFALRYRLDGVLQSQPELPFDLKAAIISRIKIMADLDISERRRPQDGRIRVEGGGKAIDLRVSVIPTDFGEKVAIRILDKTQLKLDIDNLGLETDQLRLFQAALARPNGIILVTGPTGSGKTTSLYAALNYVKNPRLHILTIEDPIEYNLDGVNQSQVKREIGYDFAAALRTFLRQDPDVILVGEIRDLETAEIAIRASLTGHLVLSTLHTNDAATAITRLVDLGIEPYLVASSLNLVIAQRLVRQLCRHCRLPSRATDTEIEKITAPQLRSHPIFRPVGCSRCLQTGYSGRTAVFELMPINESISEMIHSRQPAHQIRAMAVSQGMTILQQSGIQKVAAGITSLEEVTRAL